MKKYFFLAGLAVLLAGFWKMNKDVVAKTIWGEARGEGVTGMQAVANVIANRVNATSHNKEYGTGWTGVCKKPYQFSCWNAGDINKAQMLIVTDLDSRYKEAKEIATKAISGELPDITGGATFYHAVGVNPAWNMGLLEKTAQIGRHVFYKYKK